MSDLLEGVRVVEMASLISGPYAGLLLADAGAEVIKIELPEKGDPFRFWGSKVSSAPFAALNRGKKSVALDVKTEKGRAFYRTICESADVVIENFRPGVLERYGVGYDVLQQINGRLVYCSVTGMGDTGPSRDLPVFDSIIQGMSGLWSQLTDMGDPDPLGPALADHVTGLYAAYGVLAGLVRRSTSGRGGRVDVPMLGAMLAFQHLATADYLINGIDADKDSRVRGSQCFAFIAGDGLPFTIHLSSPPKFWDALLVAIDRPDLGADARFRDRLLRAENYLELKALLSEVFRTRSRDEWLEILHHHDVPAGPINTVGQALSDPQVKALDLERWFGEGDRAVRLIGSPLGTGSNPDPGVLLPPPELGEHTNEVLTALGVSEAELV